MICKILHSEEQGKLRFVIKFHLPIFCNMLRHVFGLGWAKTEFKKKVPYRKLTVHVDNAKRSLRYTKLTRIFQKLGLHTSN